jgi:uncharacterized protein YqeY
MQAKIKDLLKEAMKSGDETAKSVYRGLLTMIMNELVNTGKTPQDTPTDELVITVIKRAVKQRDDAISQFTNGGRPELAESEIAEKNILMQFLPKQLSVEEIAKEVATILETLKPLDPKNLGKYIGACNAKLKEIANGKDVKEAVEKFLQNNI